MSYKSDDRIAPLVAALDVDDIGLWWDANLGGGSAWRASIESELKNCVRLSEFPQLSK